MSFAAASNWSHMRASMVPLRSPSSRRRYARPSRVLRNSFSCTRKKLVMFCSVSRSVTYDVFIGLRVGRRPTDFLDFGIAAAGNLLVARFDDHVALLAQRFQIIAHGRLHAFGIQVVRNFIFHLG